MELGQMFSILKIEKTKDEEMIREAYRLLLPLHHPEEDPAGFTALREAYEGAIAFARRPEEADSEEDIRIVTFRDDRDIIGHFYNTFVNIYCHWSRRIDPAEWERLLEDPALFDLDREEEAKRELFCYLEEHYHLPSPVWSRLVQSFGVRENRSAYLEFLPEGFVNFMLDEADRGEDERDFYFPFATLADYPENDVKGDIDRFIEGLFREMHTSDEDETWGKGNLLELEAFGIRHPWLDILRLKADVREGDTSRIAQELGALLEAYPQDERLLFDAIEIYRRGDCGEEMSALCRQIIEQDPSLHGKSTLYRAHLSLGKLAEQEGRLEDAFSSYQEASYQIYSDEVMDLMEDSGRRLVAYYEQKEQLSDEEKVSFLNACDRSEQPKAGVAYFEEREAEYIDTVDFHYGMGCLYDSLFRFPDTRREIEAGKRALEREKPDNDKALAKFLILEANAFRQEANSLSGTGEENTEETARRAQCFEQALTLLEQAQEKMDSANAGIRFALYRIRIYGERKAPGDGAILAEECERILAEEPAHYLALKHLQIAQEMLGNAQEVIDLYHRAREIYAQDPEIYELAARTFVLYRQNRDVLNVVTEAKEAGAVSDKLRIYGYYARGVNAVQKEEWQAAIEEADDVIRTLTEGIDAAQEAAKEDMILREKCSKDKEALGIAYFYRSKLYREPEQLAEFVGEGVDRAAQELEDLQQALKYADLTGAHYRIGEIYSDLEDETSDKEQQTAYGDLAYQHLHIAAERGSKNPWLYSVLANYSWDRDLDQAAVRYLSEALEMLGEEDEWGRKQYKRLTFWYRYLYLNTYNEEYAAEALRCADISDRSIGETVDTFMDRGRVYNTLGRYEEALAAWQHALELLEKEEDNLFNKRRRGWACNGVGNAYKNMHQYEYAFPSYQRALSIFDTPDFWEDTYAKSTLDNLSDCYLYGKKYSEGIEFFEGYLRQRKASSASASSREKDRMQRVYEALIDLSFSMGDHMRALSYIDRRYCGADVAKLPKENLDWAREAEKLEDILWYQLCFPTAFTRSLEEACQAAMDALERVDVSGLKDGEQWADSDEARAYAEYLTYIGKYLCILGNDDASARRYLERALEVFKAQTNLQTADHYRPYQWLMWVCRFQGDIAGAQTYATEYVRGWEGQNSFCKEMQLSLPEAVQRGWAYAKVSCYALGVSSLAAGDICKAKEYLGYMKDCRLCTACDYEACFEQLGLLAAIAYFEGDQEEAKRLCDAMWDACWDHHFYLTTMLLNRMKK